MPNIALKAHQPLEGRIAAHASVAVTPAAEASRLSLRARPEAVAGLSKALGIDLPSKPKSSAAKGSRTAFWLGPDEWYVIDDANKDLLGEVAKVSGLFSPVDISQRNTAILVSGENAEATISAGCPQNLSAKAFPVGSVSRTLLGKVEVIVYRVKPQVFRVECWRSFSDYVFTFLSESARDAAA